MIVRFRQKGLERFFATGDRSGINSQQAARLGHLLAALAASAGPKGMNMPGYRLHPLKGGRKGQWAVWVSANWRLVFEFDGENATNVELVDYH
jgi:proteic killer suppression protein